jgi:predicted nucleic acid-binding protein
MVYADTSALIKLILREEGSLEFGGLVGSCDALFSVAIAYVELRAAVASAIRGGRIQSEQRGAVMTQLESLWGNVSEISVDTPLIRQAGSLAEAHGLRGYDAIHLAAYLEISDGSDITFACWDQRLSTAA